MALRPASSALLPVAVPRASPSGKTPSGQQGPGPQKAAAGVWHLCHIPGTWDGSSCLRWWPACRVGVGGGVGGLRAWTSVPTPGKVASARERGTAVGGVLCLEVPLLGKGRGRSAPLAPSPHSCTLWHGQAGGFCRKLDSSRDKVAARDSPPHQTRSAWR